MPRRLAVGTLLALAFAAPGARVLAQTAEDRILLDDGADRLILTAPATRVPRRGDPAQLARTFLASRADLHRGVAVRDLRVARFEPGARGGYAVRFGQTVGGLDVVGAHAAVRLDGDGRVIWARSSLRALPAQLTSSPTVSAAAAINDAAVAAGSSPPVIADPTRHARLLVWAPPHRAPAVAWEVRLPFDPVRRTQMRAFVDAHTGDVLAMENRVRFAGRALVFDENPAVDDLAEVTLELPAGATTLANLDVRARSCVERQTCHSEGFHHCEYEAAALPDAEGDFLAYTRPGDDNAPEDPFAEVQLYHHVTKAFEALRRVRPGFVLADRPLMAIANFRRSNTCLDDAFMCTEDGDFTGTGGLQPYDNAFYTPADNFWSSDELLVFGQGTGADFGWDGDVVYHELGHAVVFSLTDLSSMARDDRGLNTTGGGLHEGYADYLSSMITGDPEVGEWAGASLGTKWPSGAIRSLTNDFTCPHHLGGESHYDSESWAAALWSVRQAHTPEDRDAVDGAVLVAISMLGRQDGFAMASALTAAEIEATLGPVAGADAAATFAARGVDGCADRVRTLALGESVELVSMVPPQWIGRSPAPGPLQFRIDLSAPAFGLTVTAPVMVRDGGDCGEAPPDPAVDLLMRPDDPITWTEGGRGELKDDAGQHVRFALSGTKAEARVVGPLPAGSYYLTLASWAGQVVTRDLAVTLTPPPPDLPDAGAVDAGAVDARPADAGAGDAASETGGGGAGGGTGGTGGQAPGAQPGLCGGLPCRNDGCGCRLGTGRSSVPVAFVMIVVAAVLRIRRRRPSSRASASDR